MHPMSGDMFHPQRGFGSLSRITKQLDVKWDGHGIHYAGNEARYALQNDLLVSERGYLHHHWSPVCEDIPTLRAMRQVA